MEQSDNMASFEISTGLASEADCLFFVSEYPRDRRIRVRIGNIIGHNKATKSHIMSRWSMIVCHYCGQTLTIDHMLLLCPVLQECREEYYSADSLSTLFKTNRETRILEFLREAGSFYLIWTLKHSIQFFTRATPDLMQLLTSTSSQAWKIQSALINLFREWK